MDLRAARHWLQSGHYERVADWLHAAQIASDEAGNPLVAMALTAAHQICLACSQSRADVEWHQRASEEAAQREERLRQNLQSMLERIGSQETATALTTLSPATYSTVELEMGGQAERPNLWQQLRNLFGHGQPALPSEERVRLPSWPAAQPAPPQLQELTLPFAEQDQTTVNLLSEQLDEPAPTAPGPEGAPSASWVEPTDRASSVETEIEGAPSTTSIEPAALATPTETETPGVPLDSVEEPGEQGSPSLTVYCLGSFQVYQDDQPVEEWPSSKGQSIFKYLVTHRDRPIAKEVLMELLWPEANPEAARNNLNVAIYGLRRALRRGQPAFSYVLFQNDAYLLNPELSVWVDAEEFIHHCRTGQRLEQAGELEQAIHEYRTAESLYQGEFLEEDRYEDWLLAQRQHLQDDYLNVLDRLSQHYLAQADYSACIVMCGKLLAIDSCREDTHRQLMRCYSRQGHYHLALRQYHLCVEALRRELEVEPDEETEALYTQIRRRKRV
jgi:DNA-binding SARP family transcriptional activator